MGDNARFPNAEIGEGTVIEENVTVGFRYHPACGKAFVGAHSILRLGTIVYGDVKTGAYFQSGHYTVIRARVETGDYCTVTNHAVIEGMVRMGDGVRIMSHAYVCSRTCFGDRVIVGPGVRFLNDCRPGRDREPSKGPFIEDDVMIGGGSVILPGVRVGARSFIASGAVVTRDVPPRSLVMGVPARCRPLPPEMDMECLPDIPFQRTDLWHPEGPSPFDAHWIDEYGAPPVPQPL